MNRTSVPRRRLRIERLEIDLHGMAPATAEATARSLGPLLGEALAARGGRVLRVERIDAGRIVCQGSPTPHELAARIAQRIADDIDGKDR